MINNIYLLVGGEATRLRPLSEGIPKALLTIKGRLLIDLILENLKELNHELCHQPKIKDLHALQLLMQVLLQVLREREIETLVSPFDCSLFMETKYLPVPDKLYDKRVDATLARELHPLRGL